MFLVLGESLIDMVEQPDGSFMAVAGGAPYNFARAMALQGMASGYLNPFSSDAFGTMLRDTLLASGAQALGPITDKPSSLAFVATDAKGQPQYSFYRSQVADREIEMGDVHAHTARPGNVGFHTGGLGLVPPDDQLALAALGHARASGLVCSVDLNMRPAVARSLDVEPNQYRGAALAAARAADIVKVSDEDLRNLGFAQPLDGARALLSGNGRLVVLTLGATGAWALGSSMEVFQAALPVTPIDSVGAGDCFFAGFIVALQRADALRNIASAFPARAQLEQALKHASACAAINLMRKGCAPPTWDEAQRYF